MADWSQLLRDLREKERLTREQLARAAAVAPATVKAYELGHRNPSRPLLTALVDALKADMHTRRAILEGAGFSSDGGTPSDRTANEYFSQEEAIAEVDASPFPCCVSTEVLEVVAANPLLERIWEREVARGQSSGFESSMMSRLRSRSLFGTAGMAHAATHGRLSSWPARSASIAARGTTMRRPSRIDGSWRVRTHS